MAVPAGTTNTRNLGMAGTPVTLGDGTLAYAAMVVGVDGTGTAAPAGTAAEPVNVAGVGTSASAGTNLSGTATTTSGGFNLPASATRRPGAVQGQNVGAVNIGFNEFGGTAVIGAAGTYTVTPGNTFSISTNNLVNFIAASGTSAVTITSIP